MRVHVCVRIVAACAAAGTHMSMTRLGLTKGLHLLAHLTQDAQADANIYGGEARGKEVAEESEDEEMCRYCFEGSEEGELISPCKCQGGQKRVHLSCLRRWQRMVLVSQVCAWRG